MIFLLVGGVVLQAALPGVPFLGHAKFPFLLSVVVYGSLSRRAHAMLMIAVAAGLLQDALDPLVPVGTSVLCFCLIGGMAGRFRRLVLAESPATPIVFGGVAGLVAALTFSILLYRVGLLAVPLNRVFLHVIGVGILAAVTTPLLFLVGGALDRCVGNLPGEEVSDGVE